MVLVLNGFGALVLPILMALVLTSIDVLLVLVLKILVLKLLVLLKKVLVLMITLQDNFYLSLM